MKERGGFSGVALRFGVAGRGDYPLDVLGQSRVVVAGTLVLKSLWV